MKVKSNLCDDVYYETDILKGRIEKASQMIDSFKETAEYYDKDELIYVINEIQMLFALIKQSSITDDDLAECYEYIIKLAIEFNNYIEGFIL